MNARKLASIIASLTASAQWIATASSHRVLIEGRELGFADAGTLLNISKRLEKIAGQLSELIPENVQVQFRDESIRPVDSPKTTDLESKP